MASLKAHWFTLRIVPKLKSHTTLVYKVANHQIHVFISEGLIDLLSRCRLQCYASLDVLVYYARSLLCLCYAIFYSFM